ncbi:MAG TPA: lactate racemase domain-containing protein [Gaiellaceae bacterium]|jgi:nickel-dependent lactate racemase|nr:lactate racemase domain-containing protein [Gaiellaceae bacterium]
MAYKAVIPYESLDPLTIGASGDEDKVSRDTLELEIPDANLLAAIYPDEPSPVPDATAAAGAALASPVSGPTFAELLDSATKVCVIIDNQFRPTPQSKLLPPVLDALEAAAKPAVVVCANGKVFPMSDSDIEQKIGKDNLARMERLGIAFHQNDPRNADNYEYVGVSSRGTPVWLHKEVAACDVKVSIGQAQSNHWGAGGGGKLILPGVVSDETIESNHCAFVPSPQTHYGAYAGPMRSDIDEVATMCGLSATMNVVLDTHGRVIECIFGPHPDAHRRAIERFNEIYAYGHPGTQADIAICGVFAPTDHLFFHTGWGCMSADFVVKDGGSIIYCSPSPGVSTAIGDFPGLALMDLMKPYMPATPENYQSVLKDIHARAIQMWAGCIWVPIYEVMTRKQLTLVTLAENLELAADIGIDATTSLDEAFAAALERHGVNATVIVLPYARYQLPANMVRMDAEPIRYPEEALVR